MSGGIVGDVVEGAVALLGQLFALHGQASAAEKKQIEALLDDAKTRLQAIEPNAPRIHELAERRRAELEEEAHRRRQDEPTSKHDLPSTLKTNPAEVDRSIDPATGMQREYLVLSDEERARGFVRPVRRSYRHLKCGGTTTMGVAIAETYARDPTFYGGTFCARCGTHFPVGPTGEFVWDGTTEKVGT